MCIRDSHTTDIPNHIPYHTRHNAIPYRTHNIPDNIILSIPYPTKNTHTNLKTKKNYTNSKIKILTKTEKKMSKKVFKKKKDFPNSIQI